MKEGKAAVDVEARVGLRVARRPCDRKQAKRGSSERVCRYLGNRDETT